MKNAINEYKEILANHPNLFSNENAFIKIITNESEVQDWVKKRKAELRASGKPEDWASIGVVLNDPYIIVVRDLVEFPGEKRGTYFRVINQADLRGGQGVVVLAEMNKRFLLLNQFRHPTRSWSYEIPRGFGEPGVPADEQARNEVDEEVGGKIGELIDLGIYHSNTGLEGNKVKLFYAKLNSFGLPAKDEGIESIFWVSLAELENMIASAQITDGFTIAAYTRAKLRGLLG